MGRWVENEKNRVKSRHMVEQAMDWLDDATEDEPYRPAASTQQVYYYEGES